MSRGIRQLSDLVGKVTDPKPRRHLIDLTGKRFGHLVVLRIGPVRTSPCGVSSRDWWCLCDCGERVTVRGQSLRIGATTRCSKCSRLAAAGRGRRASVRLPSGRTIAEVAEDAGLKLDTVYHRYLRGWPEDRLGLPARPWGQSRSAA